MGRHAGFPVFGARKKAPDTKKARISTPRPALSAKLFQQTPFGVAHQRRVEMLPLALDAGVGLIGIEALPAAAAQPLDGPVADLVAHALGALYPIAEID